MDKRKKSSPWPWIVAGGLMLPVLYVLSLGPVVWLFNFFDPVPETVRHALELFYTPLFLLTEASGFARWLLELCMSFWQ
jgi:hypothetical protein